MKEKGHISILRGGVAGWNQWRKKNPRIKPDLTGADLSRLTNTDLKFINFARVNFTDANLDYAYLKGADLCGAKLHGAKCHNATFIEANLTGASWLEQGSAARTSIVRLAGTWTFRKPTKAVPVLWKPKSRALALVIDTIAKKAVLILGRFTPKRMAVLHKLKEALRARGLIPILFDFDQPASRTIIETVSALAHLARFVIADLTDARSIPQELERIVPRLPSLPIQPIIAAGQGEWGTYDFMEYPWVLATHEYRSATDLLANLNKQVIARAEKKAKEIEKRRARPTKRSRRQPR